MSRRHEDNRVSETYRDVATERTPAALDEKVLAMASREARTRYGLARAWIRPVAWAATIGLTVAIVLEVTQNTYVAEPPRPDRARQVAAPAGSNAEAGRARTESDDANLEKRRDTAAPSAAADSVPAAPPASEPAERPAPAALDSAAVARELESDEMPLLRQAEEQAQRREGETRAVSALVDQPLAATAAAKQETAACDAEARALAPNWYACIEALRDAGFDDAAAAELDELRLAFPEFREPQAK